MGSGDWITLHLLSAVSIPRPPPQCIPVYGIGETAQEQHGNVRYGCLLWKEKAEPRPSVLAGPHIWTLWMRILTNAINTWPRCWKAQDHIARGKNHTVNAKVTPLPGLHVALTLYLEYSLKAFNSTKGNIFNQGWGDDSEGKVLVG